jgi:MFS family permease
VLLGLALTSTGVFIAQSAASSYVGRLAEGARGAAVGLYVMFYYTGGSFGAAIPGTFWNRGGWPATVALIAAVEVITIALCILFWKPAAGLGPRTLRRRPSGIEPECDFVAPGSLGRLCKAGGHPPAGVLSRNVAAAMRKSNREPSTRRRKPGAAHRQC